MNQRKQNYRLWSNEEVELLRSLYPTTRVRDLASKFPNRSKDTIVIKALSLGLPSAKIWQFRENEILTKYFVNSSKDQLIILLPNRSWSAILAQGERLGLNRNRSKPRLNVNEKYFAQWSANMAYILGFTLADGCIIKGTYLGYSDALKFGVQQSDEDILVKIKNELRSNHKISRVKNAAHFCIVSQKIVEDLKKLGITYRKSLHERIPRVPEKYLRDFVRGIIDGDGGIWKGKNGQVVLILCGGIQTISFVKQHFMNLLKLERAVILKMESSVTGDLYQIKYRGKSAIKILKYLYQDARLFLDRKYKLYETFKDEA